MSVKKILVLILSVLLLACGGPPDPDPPTSEDPQQVKADRTLSEFPGLIRMEVRIKHDPQVVLISPGVVGVWLLDQKLAKVAGDDFGGFPIDNRGQSLHECGHAVLDLLKTKEEVEAAAGDWYYRTINDGPWPTEYAKTNYHELFAELVRIERDDRLRRIQLAPGTRFWTPRPEGCGVKLMFPKASLKWFKAQAQPPTLQSILR